MTGGRIPLGDLDIVANRTAKKWTYRELIGRALWECLRRPLFAWTPRPMWGWRRAVLRLFGARIGRDAHVYSTVRIAIPWHLDLGDFAAVGDRAIIYNLGIVTIGTGATISQYAHICAGTHDYRHPDFPLVKAPVTIGEGAWICADAFVGPGVSIGQFAIVGARAVAMKDVRAWAIAVGNPSRVVKERPKLKECVSL